MTTTAGAALNAESITVDAATTKKLYSGTYLYWMNAADDYTFAVVTVDVETGLTEIPVLPLSKAIEAGATTTTYGGIELAAAEAIPVNASQQLNEVILLQSGGAVFKAPQSSSWNVQATYYRPTDYSRAESYRLLLNAYQNKQFVYVEIMHPSGYIKSGNATFSAMGETAQGAGYLQVSATLEGNGELANLELNVA